MGLTFRVDYEPDDLVRLAEQLAEALHKASTNQEDAETFRAASKAERTKAQSLRTTIGQVKDYRRKGPPPGSKPRRMDPWSEYDLGAMARELSDLLTRADELRKKADAYKQEANRQRQLAQQLQRKIAEARKARGGS